MIKKRGLWYCIIMFFVIIFLTIGCESIPVKYGTDVDDNETAVSYPLTIEDYAGNEVILGEKPERIISLMPSNTEILFALELDKNVIGVTDFCSYPEEAIQKTKIGDSFNINLEKVVSLEPDLVLGAGGQEEIIESLQDMDIAAVIINPTNVEETMESIELIGRMTDQVEKANSITKKMREDIKVITEITDNIDDTEKPNVLILLDTESLFTAGRDTFIDELINMSGGKNIAGEVGQSYFELNEEQILAENPDIIISTFPMREEIMNRVNWQELNALKQEAIYDVDGDTISRPGPRLAEGLQRLYEIFGHDPN